MPNYILYNADQIAARFEYAQGMIRAYEPVRSELLPMQIRSASADGFTGWIRERAIDLNTVQHFGYLYLLRRVRIHAPQAAVRSESARSRQRLHPADQRYLRPKGDSDHAQCLHRWQLYQNVEI